MTRHYRPSEVQDYYWDESNRLRSLVRNSSELNHYIYDASGERTLKALSTVSQLYVNGTLVDGGITLGGYTTYASPYVVVNSGGQFTKHYYAGSQRIVSKVAGTADIFEDTSPKTMAKFSALKQTQVDDILKIAELAGLGEVEIKQYKSKKEEGEESQVQEVAALAPIYFFHPDHLGSSTFLSDANGNPYQFFLNLPFGETMAEQRSSGTFNNVFKFNGKELDANTGLYYYGARYYDPRISVFISVDPMAESTMTPYQYTYQNPINLIDPTGMVAEDTGDPIVELSEAVITNAPKDVWVKGAGFFNNIFKHSNRIKAQQYNEQYFGGQADIVKNSKGSFSVNTSAILDYEDHGIYYNGTMLDISTTFNGNFGADPIVDLSTRGISGPLDGPVIWTGFGFDPGFGDMLGFYINQQIEEGNISGTTAYAAAGGAFILSKGRSGNILPKVVRNGMSSILKGEGTPIIRNGVHQVLEARGGVNAKWVGSLEWKIPDVPGTSINGTRILQSPNGKWGYVINHDYKNIISIPTSSPIK